MFPEKYGIKSIVRSPCKTVLFALLIISVTVMLCIGLCIYSAVTDYIKACSQNYNTIAELEYIGEKYPDENYYDDELAQFITNEKPDLTALSETDGVCYFEKNSSVLCLIDDLTRADYDVYSRESAVLVVKHMIWDEASSSYIGIIDKTLYSHSKKAGIGIFINADSFGDMEIKRDGTYVLTGRFIEGGNSYAWFLPEDNEIEISGKRIVLPACSVFDESTEQAYTVMANVMAQRNNSVKAEPTYDIKSFPFFQRDELTLEAGRFFTEEEYAKGKNVCIMSSRMLSILDNSVGDTVRMSPEACSGGLYDFHCVFEPQYKDYTIVGAYTYAADYGERIFLPYDCVTEIPAVPTGYRVGFFRLDNDAAESFYAAAESALPENFRLTLYDQGYAVTVGPFREIQRISVIFLCVCAVLIVAVMLLFGYLFVYRQRDTALIMVDLGSGRKAVYRYFASASVLLTLVFSAAGLLISSLCEGKVLSYISDFASKYQKQDVRYSSSAFSLTHTLAFTPHRDLRVYLLSLFVMIVLAVVACILFTSVAVKVRKSKKKRVSSAPKKPMKSSDSSFRLKYAVLSMRRGGIRTLSVILLAALAAVFFARLTSTVDDYEKQLDSINENTIINGYCSGINGLTMDELIVRADLVQSLHNAGLLSTLDITRKAGNYRYLGISVTPDGKTSKIEIPKIPQSSFALETLVNQLEDSPKWVSTTSVSHSPAFYYSGSPEFTWLDGYDETCLDSTDSSLCILPRSMAKRENIELGSTITLFVYCNESNRSPAGKFCAVDLYVVGLYTAPDSADTIYSPFAYSPVGEDLAERQLKTLTWSSVLFSLEDTEKLPELRSALENAGFTSPHRLNAYRSFAVIDDKDYMTATHALERQIQYLNILYSVLYVIIDITAIALALLMLSARKRELAIMRGLGTQSGRIFAVFTSEQAFLVIIGLLVGVLAGFCIFAKIPTLCLILCASFLICWTGASCVITGRFIKSKALAVLSDRE